MGSGCDPGGGTRSTERPVHLGRRRQTHLQPQRAQGHYEGRLWGTHPPASRPPLVGRGPLQPRGRQPPATQPEAGRARQHLPLRNRHRRFRILAAAQCSRVRRRHPGSPSAKYRLGGRPGDGRLARPRRAPKNGATRPWDHGRAAAGPAHRRRVPTHQLTSAQLPNSSWGHVWPVGLQAWLPWQSSPSGAPWRHSRKPIHCRQE